MSVLKNHNQTKDSHQEEKNKEKGIEPQDLLDYNLSLTIEERLLNHQRALETINELIKARKQIYGELESSTETPS